MGLEKVDQPFQEYDNQHFFVESKKCWLWQSLQRVFPRTPNDLDGFEPFIFEQPKIQLIIKVAAKEKALAQRSLMSKAKFEQETG